MPKFSSRVADWMAVAAFVGAAVYAGTQFWQSRRDRTTPPNQWTPLQDPSGFLRGGITVSSSAARLQFVEVSDFECPFCKKSAPIVRAFVAKFAGQVQYTLETAPWHRNSFDASMFAACGNLQGRFWELPEALFEHQHALDAFMDSLKTGKATVDGVDLPALRNCLDDPAVASAVAADTLAVAKLRVRGTPTFVVGGSLYGGVLSAEALDSIAKANGLVAR